MHGPEHHMIDGACILTAYYHKTHAFDLKDSLERLANESVKMPGAMCGKWGVCGAVTSIGAALAIIDGTGLLSSDGSWGEHMEYASKTIQAMGKINGPRCCKRDGVLSIQMAIEYINQHKDVQLDTIPFKCSFSSRNMQCIHERCPYYQH